MTKALPYIKMNGLGNDFVVLDGRETPVRLSRDQVRGVCDREHGVGCDQLIVIEKAGAEDVDAFMRIYNAEGGEVDACGNATRCIAALLTQESGREHITLLTHAGVLNAQVNGESVTVDMGPPKLAWDEIPLAEEFHDTTGVELQIGPIDAPLLHTPSVVNVGNPHAIFWVQDLDAHDLSRFGPLLEHHPLFPERANITLAKIVSPERIAVRVWERGAGLTRACGTAACATAVAAVRKELSARTVTIELPGGPLTIEWRERDSHVLMTGPWQRDGEGAIDPALLAQKELAP